MSAASSPQQLFAAAEQAYATGRFDQARAGLVHLERMGVRHPAVHHLRAIVERELGNQPAANGYFEAATALAPGDPQIANNHGNLLSDLGDDAGALAAYERALKLAPTFAEAMFNRALLLQRLGRRAEARRDFLRLTGMQPTDVRFWCGLGSIELEERNLDAATQAYERALAVQPRNPIAASGRARIAMERGEADVVTRYQAVRRLAPEDRQLIFEETEARLAESDPHALDDFGAFVRRAPDWTMGQVALARMLYVSGETERFSEHIEEVLQSEPQRSDLWGEYIELLGSCGLVAEASDVTAKAGAALGGADWLTLTEAAFAGRAGQLDRAEKLLSTVPANFPGRAIHDCIHAIRRARLDEALRHLEAAFSEDAWNHSYWAIAELLYRKVGDPRSEWLSGQQGLIGRFELSISDEDFAAVRALLLQLHKHGAEMVGQSVRHGTQTRWKLFDRHEPELLPLRNALHDALQLYLSALPQADPRHPMLRLRNESMRISGSWSVRLTGSGHHVPHVHPEGMISSACYIEVPQSSQGEEGWLELGRSPPDLLMDLQPLRKIQPSPRRLVLFPSFLYHGTRPFSAGERMSVAFDVTPLVGA